MTNQRPRPGRPGWSACPDNSRVNVLISQRKTIAPPPAPRPTSNASSIKPEFEDRSRVASLARPCCNASVATLGARRITGAGPGGDKVLLMTCSMQQLLSLMKSENPGSPPNRAVGRRYTAQRPHPDRPEDCVPWSGVTPGP